MNKQRIQYMNLTQHKTLLNQATGIDWDLEGELTVGILDLVVIGATGNFYGYDDGSIVEFGSITIPSVLAIIWSDENISDGEPNQLIVRLNTNKATHVEIDGVIFEDGHDYTNFVLDNVLTNPFPAVGETCTVKIKLS